tara:strand:+ start:232 stop:765 length:534 start_codon:yes stop_codon:yes gene_type:complete
MKKQKNKIEVINNPSNIKLEYDEISPISGRKCVVVEADEETNIESYICMESGYTTTDKLKIGSKEVEYYEQTITELMKSVKYEDKERKLIWYPSFMQVPGAMLYCKGTTFEDMEWEVATIVPIHGEERLKYPIPGKEEEYYTSKLDVENAKTYSKREFQKAFDDLYAKVKEEVANEN